MKGIIVDVKHFEMHDGDGMRTTLFLKGCPLRCQWCHNPESLVETRQLAFYGNKCIHCGNCVMVCKRHAHKIINGRHVFDFGRCIQCGECVSVCPRNALKIFGKEVSAEEIATDLFADKIFYDETGGGVTISGGEPLMQADFCRELLKILQSEGVNCALDTSLYAVRSEVEKVLPYTDTFLVDIKAVREEVHAECTGKSNRLILENLKFIDSEDKKIEIRIPYIPGMNETTADEVAEILCTLKNLQGVKILPYHNLARAKYAALGLQYNLGDIIPPSKEEIEAAALRLFDKGVKIISY